MRKTLNKKQKNPGFSSKLSHVLIAVITCLVLVLIVEWDTSLFDAVFTEGDIVLKSTYAPFDFKIKGEIDSNATESARKSAMEKVPPVYLIDSSIKETVLSRVNSISDAINSLHVPKEGESPEDRLSRIKETMAPFEIPMPLTHNMLELKDPKGFFEEAVKTAEYILDTGLISSQELARLDKESVKTVTLLDKAKNTEQVKFTNELWLFSDARKRADNLLAALKEKKEKALLIDLISGVITTPNIKYQDSETDFRRQAAAAKVKPIYTTLEVKKNELIINKGERISKEDMLKLEAIAQKEPYPTKVVAFFGIALIIILFMLILVFYIEFYEPDLIVGNKELVLLASICVLVILAAKLIVLSPYPSNFIPIAAASMLIALLLNSRLAIITTCFLGILAGMVSGGRMDIAAMSIIGGMIGIFAVRNVRRRSQLISAGFLVGLANMTYFIAIGLINSLDFHTYMTEASIGMANGMVSAIIVTGVLPIFESMFKSITDISLLETADLNHPILKEMVIKAPGTYHHSLVVGNLAEAACETIGANALLARVSSYFHDIGKIEKAEYFSENQAGESPHDKLSPTMSSLIITNHVKNGVELAEKYGLNTRIVAIIKQHHGTGLVFYFFKRALEKTVEDQEVFEEGFRYPGPKPQTKEAACVLLADSVEAASRTLDDPTTSSIQGLVKKIINNKFIDGQLDECELTLKDLEKIADVFTHILTGIYHNRVEYPEDTGKKKA
ncbi:MAG: HDIG domain-containing protein [Candidatus Omnitrophota bacterium]|nr:HDIG domain-containing protein [Candidatus Omnitrophota bacterium]